MARSFMETFMVAMIELVILTPVEVHVNNFDTASSL